MPEDDWSGFVVQCDECGYRFPCPSHFEPGRGDHARMMCRCGGAIYFAHAQYEGMKPIEQRILDQRFKFVVADQSSRSYQEIANIDQPARLRRVSKAFVENASRATGMVSFVAFAVGFTREITTGEAGARFRALGSPTAQPQSQEELNKLRAELAKLDVEEAEKNKLLQGSQLVYKGLKYLDIVTSGIKPSNGIVSMLSAQVVGTWTAFETLASDLWEEAINEHPEGLADLKGIARGKNDSERSKPEAAEPQDEDLEGEDQDRDDEDEDEERGPLVRIPRKLVQRRGYNLENLMGTALRHEFKFSTLKGIRKAYERAFRKHGQAVMDVLNSPNLDSASLVRNLIVHRAGIADGVYERRARNLPLIPKLSVDQAFPIDGQIVKDLTDVTNDCSIRLFKAVVGWLAAHPRKRQS